MDNSENQNVEPQTEEVIAEEVQPSTEELIQQIKELTSKLKDEQLRSAATVQNLNRRHREEIEAAHKFAGTNFVREMLPVKDYLEMALMDKSGNFDMMKMGVEMTLKQLLTAFDKVNVKEVNPMGEKLDPNLHQAMSTEVSEQPVGTIIKVLQKGYVLNDRILRPAMVVVSAVADELQDK